MILVENKYPCDINIYILYMYAYIFLFKAEHWWAQVGLEPSERA